MGNVNWSFPGLGAFFVTFYQWISTGPFLFVLLCVCGWGVLQLATTSGRQGWVPFVGAPIAIIIILALPSVFPALGTA